MTTMKYVHWRDGNDWLGYFVDYPDYWMQGDSLEDLQAQLTSLYHDLTSGVLPEVRKVSELVIS